MIIWASLLFKLNYGAPGHFINDANHRFIMLVSPEQQCKVHHSLAIRVCLGSPCTLKTGTNYVILIITLMSVGC